MTTQHRTAATELTPTALVERVLTLNDQLMGLLDQETEFLKTHQPLRIGELQDEKTRLANEYAMDIQAIRLRKELIDRAPAEKVARLRTAMVKLDATLAANRTALAATKSVSERILKAVAQSVSEHKAPAVGYGRNAALARPATSQPSAIALDSRV